MKGKRGSRWTTSVHTFAKTRSDKMAETKDGVVSIHGKSYKTVALRVMELHELYPTGVSLNTEVLKFHPDEFCLVKAELSVFHVDADGVERSRVFTGHAFEKTTTSQINKTSHLENCETSAIGRALAAAGLAGSEFASADELVQALNQQGPVNTTEQAPGVVQTIQDGPDAPPQNSDWMLLSVSVKREGESSNGPWRILQVTAREVETNFEQTFDIFDSVMDQAGIEQAIHIEQVCRIVWKKGKNFEQYGGYDISSLKISEVADKPDW